MANIRKPKLENPGGIVEFQYDPETFEVTPEMQEVFDWDGAFVVRNFLNNLELEQLWKGLTVDSTLMKRAWDLSDGEGRASRLVLWGHPGNDVTGMMARSEKVAGTCEKLLGGEVYHYHTKLMMKEPLTGGKHLWHQDYGYWYKNGCLRPDLMTVFIALDPCNKKNGGLQVLKGTQRCGRIEHDLVHGQTVANMERINQLSKHHEHVYTDLNPGDALFFHSNLLHTSDRNESDVRRYAFLCAYNRADNDPVYKHHHPNYTPLHKVPNSAILECTNFADFSGDALFFHSNLLHTSDRNESEIRRYAFLCAYNRADNDPVYKHHCPNYTPLLKVPNSAILECTNFTDFSGKEFMDPSQDKTVRAQLIESNFH